MRVVFTLTLINQLSIGENKVLVYDVPNIKYSLNKDNTVISDYNPMLIGVAQEVMITISDESGNKGTFNFYLCIDDSL